MSNPNKLITKQMDNIPCMKCGEGVVDEDTQQCVVCGDATLEVKLEAQRLIVSKRGFPHFAPADGICWACYNQIYENMTLEKAGREPITRCPRCSRSYCD